MVQDISGDALDSQPPYEMIFCPMTVLPMPDRDLSFPISCLVQAPVVLLGRLGVTCVDEMRVWDNYGKPDGWDPVYAFMKKGEEQVTVEAENQFPFISAVY